MIPIAKPDLGQEEIDAVADVIRSGIIASGPRVRELEAAWAAYCGVGHAIAVANGTLALMGIFEGLKIGHGDEVITVPFTFVATAAAIHYTGAKTVLVDVDPGTFTMDVDAIEAAITERTKAVMPVTVQGLTLAAVGVGGDHANSFNQRGA